MLLLLEKMTWVHYVVIIFCASVIGSLLSEFLIHVFDGFRVAIEELEKIDGLKKAGIGISVTIMPLIIRIGFYVMGIYEPMMSWFARVQWPMYIFLACYILGAVWLVVGLAMFFLAVRHGK